MSQPSQASKKLRIYAVKEKTSKSGNPYRVCECAVIGDRIKVGQLMVFGETVHPAAGDWVARFDVSVNFDRLVVPQLVELLPVTPGSKVLPGQPQTFHKRIEILDLEEKKTKKGGKWFICECLVHGDEMQVGQLSIFGDKVTPSVGEFMAEFEIDVNYDRQVTASIVALRSSPLAAAPKAPAPAAGASQAA